MRSLKLLKWMKTDMETAQDIPILEKNTQTLKIALVHDFLLYRGGAERVLRSFSNMFPAAPIYTLLYDEMGMKGMFVDREVRASFLGSWPKFLQRRHRWLLPIYPVAIEALDLRNFDVVLSSSGAWSKGVVTRLYTKHVAYIHSPMRFVWDQNERYLKSTGGFHFCKRTALSYLRLWDKEAADRPDTLIANSAYTASRIDKYYRRSSEVVFPPVGKSLFALESTQIPLVERPFVVVSRLSVYKHIDRIVRVFAQLKLPLLVIGTGAESARLRRIAPSNIRFLGEISDADLMDVYRSARAFVFAGEEDFGLGMAEAQASGIPVVALAHGGAREIVDDGVTGVLFDEPSVQGIERGISIFLDREATFDRTHIRHRAERFSETYFQTSIRTILSRTMSEGRNRSTPKNA